MNRTIALLTDFGLDDPYVGQMKGVLAKLAPSANIVDLSHGIEPFCITQGAFYLWAAMPHFPEDTIFITVIDPGVGTNRRIIGCEIGKRVVIAPDNGLVELAEQLESGTMIATDLSSLAAQGTASATFHGRDLFAPIGAAVARGKPMSSLGPKLPLRDVVRTGINRPIWMENGVEAIVLHRDRFGNLILNIRDNLTMPERMTLPEKPPRHPDCRTIRRAACYAELPPKDIGLIIGSQGFYELAVNKGSAAKELAIGPGDSVTLTW